jgi:hypothetical protein
MYKSSVKSNLKIVLMKCIFYDGSDEIKTRIQNVEQK